jgi:uncharacterized protein YkwD
LSLFRTCLVVPLLLSLGCANAASDDESAGESGAGSGGAGSGGTGGTGGGGGTGGTAGTSNAGTGGNAGKSSGGVAGSPNATGGGSGEAGESASSGTGGSSGGTGGSSGGSGGGSGTGSAPAGSGGQIGNHTNPLSQTLIDAFVAAHNAARSRTDLDPPPDPALPPVSWDAMLADAAYNYLSLCEVEGDLVAHNDDRTKDYAALGGSDYVGENIYASSGTSVEPSDAIDSWMSEQSEYDYADGDFSKAGHYTQVVWRSSVRIGCAIVNCPNARYSNTVLCDYAPGGNLSGQKPY